MKPSDRIIAEAEHMLSVVLPPGSQHDPATRAEALARATLSHIDREAESAPSVYRDTETRYLNDPSFRAAVKSLEAMAREHGFTPGELKQIAFKAALNIEMSAKPLLFVRRGTQIQSTAAPAVGLVLDSEEDEAHEATLP